MTTHIRRRVLGASTAVTILLFVISLQALLLSSCGKKTSPTQPTQSAPVVTAPPTFVALTISAPGLPLTGPNQTLQLVATASFSDGTTKDVTTLTRWSGGDPSVATLSSSGLLTTVDLGSFSVSAFYQSGSVTRSTFVTLLVLPPGTFIVSGQITEPVNQAVGGATIQVVDGLYAGRSKTADQYGNYSLPGIAGTLTLRVTKDGYLPATQPVTVASSQKVNIEVQPVVAPVGFAGSYSLTITASASCKLPSQATSRTYSAQIVQHGAGVTVSLGGGATFFASQFSGRVVGNVVNLVLGYDDYYGIYDVVERLGPTTYLAFNGSASEVTGPQTISAPFVGTMTVFEAPAGFAFSRTTTAACAASDHLMTLTRSQSQTARQR